MKEDYLWDKTGEVDPEILELEGKLSSLRYRRPAQPLPLPANSRFGFRRSFSLPLAIAAMILISVLADGLWFALHRPSQSGEFSIASGPAHPPGPVDPTTGGVAKKEDEPLTQPQTLLAPRRTNRTIGAPRLVQAKARTMTGPSRAEEIARGEVAKAQLIKALHIASDKLNAVQKKIQGPVS